MASELLRPINRHDLPMIVEAGFANLLAKDYETLDFKSSDEMVIYF